jgi:hypothetical protein
MQEACQLAAPAAVARDFFTEPPGKLENNSTFLNRKMQDRGTTRPDCGFMTAIGSRKHSDDFKFITLLAPFLPII